MVGGRDETRDRAARGLVRLILAQSIGFFLVILVLLLGLFTVSGRVQESIADQQDLSELARSVRDVNSHREAIGASVFRTRLDPRLANTNLVTLKRDVSHVAEETSTWSARTGLIHDPVTAERLTRANLIINDFAQLGLQLTGDPQQLADPVSASKFTGSFDNAALVLDGVIEGIDAQQVMATDDFNDNVVIVRVSIIGVLILLSLAGLIVGMLALARARKLSISLTDTFIDLESETRNRRIDADLREGIDLVQDEDQLVGTVQAWLPLAFPESHADLFLMDSSRAHLTLVASNGGDFDACSVDSPDSCPAIRKAMVLDMPVSEAPNACPYLRKRGAGFSAMCAPIAFGAQLFGVVHVVARSPIPEAHERTVTTASIIGARLGAMRAFGTAQMQATTDGLTGLLNRRATELGLERAHECGTPSVYAMLDIDHFKSLNDVHGHAVGDSSLRTFAGALRATMRDSDICGRFGGEEFVLVLTESTEEQARVVIDRLRTELNSACQVSGVPDFTFSAGIATSDSRSTVDEILKLADQRLLAAKAAGRNRTVGTTEDHRSA